VVDRCINPPGWTGIEVRVPKEPRGGGSKVYERAVRSTPSHYS